MKIEEGKRYRLRDGRETSALEARKTDGPFVWKARVGIRSEKIWDAKGMNFDGPDSPKCIVALADGADEGRKDDAGKARIDLIAPEFLTETAAVLEFGARKYAERNWEKGMSWGRCFGALMRHMWAWWGGEKTDAETGLSHLAHAACCLMFLMAYEKRGLGTDDRA